MFALTSSLAGTSLGPPNPDQQQRLRQEQQQQRRENQQQQEEQKRQQLADSASPPQSKEDEITSAAKEEAELQYSLQQQLSQQQPAQQQEQAYHQRHLEQQKQQQQLLRQQRLQEEALYFCMDLQKKRIPSWEWADTQVLGQQAAGVLALEAVLKATKAAAAAKAAEQARTVAVASPAATAQDASTRATATPQATTAATETPEVDVSSKSKVQHHLHQVQRQHESKQQRAQRQRVVRRCRSTPPTGIRNRSTSKSSNKRRLASLDFSIAVRAKKDEDTDICKARANGSSASASASTAAAKAATAARTTAPAADGASTKSNGAVSFGPSPSSSESTAVAAEAAAKDLEAAQIAAATSLAAGKKGEEDEGESHMSASLFLLPVLAERRLVVSAFTAPCLVQNLLQQRSKVDGIFERGHGHLYDKARDALFPQDASRNRSSDNRAGDKLQEIVRFVDSWCSNKCGRCCKSNKLCSSGNSNDFSKTSASSKKLGCGLLGVLQGASPSGGGSWGVHTAGSSERQLASAAASFAATEAEGPTTATKENSTAQTPTHQDQAAQPPPVRVFLDICGGPGSWSLFLLRQLAPAATAAAATAAAATAAAGTPADSFPWASGGPKEDVFTAIAEEVRRRLAQPQKQQQQQQQQQQAEVFGFGITLKSEGARKEVDWYQQLMHHANFTALWGRDGTGNIYHGHNILHAQQTIFAFLRSKKQHQNQEQQRQQQQHEQGQQKHERIPPMTDPVNGFEEGVALVLADGGFAFSQQDGQHVENFQELLVGRLLISEFMLMLLLLQEGGHFVIKILDCFSLFTASLIYCISQLFENALILKPFSSRAVNSERLFASDTTFIESLRQASTTLCERQTAALEKVIAKVEEMLQLKKGKAGRKVYTGSSCTKKPSLTSFEHTLEQLNLLSTRPSSNCTSRNSSTTAGAAGRRRLHQHQRHPAPLHHHQPYNARPNVAQPPPFRFSHRSSGSGCKASELLLGQQQYEGSETHRLQQQLRQLERQLHQQREDQQKQQQLQLQMQLLQMQQLQMLHYRNLGGMTTDLNQQQLLLPPQQQLPQLQTLLPPHQQLLPQQQALLQQQLLQHLRSHRQQTLEQQQALPVHNLQQRLVEQQLDTSTSAEQSHGAVAAQLQQESQSHQGEQQLQNQQQQHQRLQQQLQLQHLQKLLTEKRSQSTELPSSLHHQASWTTVPSTAAHAATAASAATGGSVQQTDAALAAVPPPPGVAHRNPAVAGAGEPDALIGLSQLRTGVSSIQQLDEQQVQHQLQHQQQRGPEDFDSTGLGASCSSPLEAAAQQQLLLLQHERARLVQQQQQLQFLQLHLLQGGLHKQQQHDEQFPKEEPTVLLQQMQPLQQLPQQQRQLLHKSKQLQQDDGGVVALDSVLAETNFQTENEL
ncbi:hypothetical protein Emag_004860 [Eimeria magna]